MCGSLVAVQAGAAQHRGNGLELHGRVGVAPAERSADQPAAGCPGRERSGLIVCGGRSTRAVEGIATTPLVGEYQGLCYRNLRSRNKLPARSPNRGMLNVGKRVDLLKI